MKRKKMEKEVVHLLEWIIEYPGVWQIVCNPDGKETSPESFKMAYDMLVKKSLFYLIPVLFATHPGEESLEMPVKYMQMLKRPRIYRKIMRRDRKR